MTDYRLDRAEAEYNLLKLEAAFRERKAEGRLTDKDRENLRLARAAYRQHYRVPAAEGVQVAAIGSSVGEPKSVWQRFMDAMRAEI